MNRAAAVVGVIALVVGFGVGAAAIGSAEPEIRTVTETVTASPIVETETVTETLEVEVTPEACLDALDAASDGFDIAADYPPLVGRAAQAGFDVDTAELKDIISDMGALNARLKDLTPVVTRASQECREAA